ncbi:hypothetical protein GIB67_028526 [Kingdonia uniflora]|uniref:Starch synthase catalytic domain-containing protein n=1 Tax=Kingdonia uniflora TaxID=39325 RepID=A0A7J7KVV7_9MAGN|nr:hypothetical protein GIB67_028526 [Kingdonia uniflora]
MTSFGSLESYVFLHNGNLRWPPILSNYSFFKGKSNLESHSVFPKVVIDGETCSSGSNFGAMIGVDKRSFLRGSRSKCVRVVGKNGSGGERADGEIGDALEATIEKSKKVLAMQRDLLQQIAERRKLVSSIRSNISHVEEDVFTYDEKEKSSHYSDSSSTGRNDSDRKYTSGSRSGSYGTPDIVDKPVHAGGGFGEGMKKPREKVPLKMDFSKQFKKASAETVQSKVVPTFLSGVSETLGLEYGSVEELAKASVTSETNEAAKKETVKPPLLAGANVMNIILVAAECAPWSKTGGLGDVAGALPKALARRGHRVMVVAPMYGNYAELKESGVRKMYKVHGQDVEVSYFQAFIDGVDFVFIESHMFRHIENNIYGGQRLEILKRMVLFCKAAIEAYDASDPITFVSSQGNIPVLGCPPVEILQYVAQVPWYVPCGGVCYGDGNLVFVANDWHTALLPVYLRAYYRDNGLMNYARSVLVIHNMAHQGRGPIDDFSYVELPENYKDLFKFDDPIGGTHFNIFAAGLKTADRIVTVSHGYSWELKTSEGGWGLHGIISENDWKLKGIVNGIDEKEWSPQVDVHLTSDGYTHYSLETLKTGKPKCKAALQKELGLPVRENVPLIGFIGRLDDQKGVDLIAEAIPWMVDQDVQLVMLGTGRPDLEQLLRHFESQHHDKVRGWVGFSVKVAHRITAGADILLMPSRFEPCGLNQLYAMSYGTVPVVHAVGGLRDTVQPFDPYNESGLGWTFNKAESGRLIHALGNCLLTYREYRNSWEGIQRRGMTQDLSWDNAAQNYEEVLVAAKYHW